MRWSVFTHLAGFIVDLAVGARRTADAKDLAIALLRHRLRQNSDFRRPDRGCWG